ncbi:MAG: hypothetical protein K0Q79_1134 [Flavipsychrobacter sp.]|jgi:hypothetical protein|nr:hypothetical protein [Flavipsychrobacter sp.]
MQLKFILPLAAALLFSNSYAQDNAPAKKYGYNIFTLVPGAYTSIPFTGTMGDPGLGACYERLLDNEGHFGFTLPFLYNFSQNRSFNSNRYYYYSHSLPQYSGPNNYSSFMFMPGFRFYPAGIERRARYAVGMSFFAMFGTEPYGVYDPAYSGTGGEWRYIMYGAMISNSINVNVTRHFFMGLEVNFGVPFTDNRRKDDLSGDDIGAPIAQFILKTGVRF